MVKKLTRGSYWPVLKVAPVMLLCVCHFRYNNQWMVLDYNLFAKRPSPTQLLDNTLVMIEQLPGVIQTNDMTPWLMSAGYLASYNVAWDPIIQEMSGQNKMQTQYGASNTSVEKQKTTGVFLLNVSVRPVSSCAGAYYSYDNTARAEIFRREAPKVANVGSLKKLMRRYATCRSS
jgi:hypothetical protein